MTVVVSRRSGAYIRNYEGGVQLRFYAHRSRSCRRHRRPRRRRRRRGVRSGLRAGAVSSRRRQHA